MTFIGRDFELKQLKAVRGTRKASLVVVSGRRRIGKSTLIHEFAKNFTNFYEFHGVAPSPRTNIDKQLKSFADYQT